VPPPDSPGVFGVVDCAWRAGTYGRHRVILYRVNEEYANLYENRNQDSRDLNEPPSNIEGALGVFSAFNSVAAEFDVVVSE